MFGRLEYREVGSLLFGDPIRGEGDFPMGLDRLSESIDSVEKDLGLKSNGELDRKISLV